jgi:hypothetical protein
MDVRTQIKQSVKSEIGARMSSVTAKNVIFMKEHTNKVGSPPLSVRDRRYAIRHPFAADAECLDLEAGTAANGITSDLSMGGCFVCTGKPLALGSRVRLKLTRRNEVMEALAVVRIVKPRIGMGIEFLDVQEKHHPVLQRWLEESRRER